MFTARYVLHSTFCPHSVFMCFVWIWEQTAIISLYSIDCLVFVTETECVYCAVGSTFYVLPTQCIYVFCVDLRTNSDYFTVQHWLVGFYNSSGGIVLPCPIQSVCQRNAPTLATRRVGPLRGRHGHHSHVPQPDAACQLPGVIPQRPSTVVERMVNRH